VPGREIIMGGGRGERQLRESVSLAHEGGKAPFMRGRRMNMKKRKSAVFE